MRPQRGSREMYGCVQAPREGIVLISGPPLLVQAATVGMKALGFKTERTVKEKECFIDTELPENRIDSTTAPIEVWVYGRIPCPLHASLGVVTD